MEKSSRIVEAWCVIEAIFYICLKLHVMWLQGMDPLERSLSSAPMLEVEERQLLWARMLQVERDDPVSFISGWFFDQPLESISKYDVRDFITWSMFEGRNQEHLTAEELAQLDDFVDEAEWCISLHMYGAEEEDKPVPIEEKNEDGSQNEKMKETGPFPEADGVSTVLAAERNSTLHKKDRQPRPKQSKCPFDWIFVVIFRPQSNLMAHHHLHCSVSFRRGEL